MDTSDLFTTELETNELKGETKPIDLEVRAGGDIGEPTTESETNELKGESNPVNLNINTGGEIGQINEVEASDTAELITGRSVGEEINNTPIELSDDIVISELDNKIDFQQYSLKNVKEAEDDYDVVIKKQLDEYVPEIADGSITTTKLADGAVTSAKIASKTIETGNIADNAVSNDKLAENAVTTSEIADAAITTAKIGDVQVTADKLASNAVTTDKISNNQVTPAKIASATYSTTEQEVGTWIDGKTIYRRVFEGTTLANEFAIGSIGTDANCIRLQGYYYTTAGFVQPIGEFDPKGTSYNSRVYFNKSNGYITGQAGSGLTGGSYYARVIVEYTKDN